MKNSDYWRGRSKILSDAAQKKADRCIKELDGFYRDALHSVQADLESWYGRFADNNGMSLKDARKMLNGDDLEEFQWSVEKYIKVGKSKGLPAEWVKKLENASAKFHVSRLEAIEMQIQQQIEVLYGGQIDSIDGLLRDVVSEGYTHGCYEMQKGIGVGWDITAIDEKHLDALLSKPWTADKKTFRDRCWEGKANLVSGVQKSLVQALLRGDSLQKTTETVKKQFGVSRYKAGRLVHTETTYFNAVSSLEAYRELGVENVEIVETLDSRTCEICAPMDGKVIPIGQYEPGVTVPPFHPNCRGTTAPAIDDDLLALDKEINGGGERTARDAKSEKTFDVPADMTYEEWKARQDALHGAGTVDLERKKHYNRKADSEQWKNYRKRLGDEIPKSFSDFQDIKYKNPEKYNDLKFLYDNTRDKPIEYARIDLDLKKAGITNKGKAYPVEKLVVTGWRGHARNRLKQSGLDETAALKFRDNAIAMMKRYQSPETQFNYYSSEGILGVKESSGVVQTVVGEDRYDEVTKTILEVMRRWLI